jgi:fucose permease
MAEAVTTARYDIVRDRPTWLSYLNIGLFGYFLYAFGPTVALLRDEQGYTRSVASLHGTAMALGSVLVGLTATRFVRWMGRGAMLRLGSALMAGGILVYTGFDPLPLTLLGIFLAACGGTFAMVGVNAFLPAHHGAASARAMSEAHGLGATMGLLGPLAIGGGVAIGWGWRPGLLATCAGLVVLEVLRGRRLADFDTELDHHAAAPSSEKRARLPRLYWYAFAVFALCAGTEFSLTLWGSDLLRERAGLGEAAAAAALVTIVGGMAVGRVGGSAVVGRFEPDRVLMGTMALSIAGFAIAWFSSSPVPMLIGFAITGLGLGLQSPLAISRAVLASGGQVDRGSGLASVAAGAASGVAPFVLAAVADAIGVHLAFLIVPALLATGIALVAAGRVPPGGVLAQGAS